MRKWFMLTLTALALLISSPGSQAQTWPAQPITLINGFPPSGGADILARPFAEKLRDALGQRVTVENRTGANGLIAAPTAAPFAFQRLDIDQSGLQPVVCPRFTGALRGEGVRYSDYLAIAPDLRQGLPDRLVGQAGKTPHHTSAQKQEMMMTEILADTTNSPVILAQAQAPSSTSARNQTTPDLSRLHPRLQEDWWSGTSLGRSRGNGPFALMCISGRAQTEVYATVAGNHPDAVGAACTGMIHTILSNPPPFPEMDTDDVFRAILERRNIPRNLINAQTLRDSVIRAVNDPNNADRRRASIEIRGADGRDYTFNVNAGLAAYVSAIQPPRNASGPIPDYASIIQEASRCFRYVSAEADPTIGHCVNRVGTPLARRARQEGPVYSTVR